MGEKIEEKSGDKNKVEKRDHRTLLIDAVLKSGIFNFLTDMRVKFLPQSPLKIF